MSTTESVPGWSIILNNRINSEPPEFRTKLLFDLDVSEQTLTRWARGRNKPDSRSKILTLMRYIPEMSDELRKSFPQYFTSSHEINARLTSPYTQRVLDAYGDVEESMLLRAVVHAVCGGLVASLDPNNEIGVAALLVQLGAEPHNPSVASYLTVHAWSAHGSGIWRDEVIERSFRVGADSLAAMAVMEGDAAFFHRDRETLPLSTSLCKHQCIESAAAYPILKSGRVAGVVSVLSAQKHFFAGAHRDLTDRRDLIKRFARMMPLAFREDQFYARNRIQFHAALTAEQMYLNALALEYPNDTPEQLKKRAVTRIEKS